MVSRKVIACTAAAALVLALTVSHAARFRQQALPESADRQGVATTITESMPMPAPTSVSADVLSDADVMQHANFSASMLLTAQSLMKRFAPRLSLSEGEVESLLQQNGDLRTAVSHFMDADDSDTSGTVGMIKTMAKAKAKAKVKAKVNASDTDTSVNGNLNMKKQLLDRARSALGAAGPGYSAQSALLEASVRGKTPCMHVLSNWNGQKLVDGDPPSAWHRGGQCEMTCLDLCKRSRDRDFHGQPRFKIDQHEMQTLGVSAHEMQHMQGPQVGAKCVWGRCMCLDASESFQRLQQAFRWAGQPFDVSASPHPFDSEYTCMSNCHDQGAWHGYCFDEFFSG